MRMVGQGYYNIGHHLAMVVTSEIRNLLSLFAGIELLIGGFVIYKFAGQFFFEMAVGLPLLLIGISIIIMKVYEIFLTILDTRRLRGICKYCKD